MKILVAILSIIIFTKTFSYGIYELENKNKVAGFTIISIAIISLILPNIAVYIRGV